MSMLAERKCKQKWSLNPRGNDWAQDANKFGQKMLEKMGWQHGKGLGAKENGMTEHVKISYKNDSKGMGYKESNDQWTEHDANFNALLESLTNEVLKSKEIKVQSLEEKSQSSRARVHYHKFTRGKDLSRYSEKELANIFGKKTLKEGKKTKLAQESKKDEGSGNLVNGGSMTDYLKKKIPGFGQSNGYVIGHNGVLKKEQSDSESELRASVGFGFKSVHSDMKNLSLVNPVSQFEAKNNFKKGMPYSPRKKSKKQNTDNNLGLSNPAFDPMSTPVKIQKHMLEPIEEGISEETLEMEVDNIITTEAEVHMEISKSVKKKAKTRQVFDKITVENNIDVSMLETPSKKQKKDRYKENCIEQAKIKKKNNESLNETIEMENPVKPKSKTKRKTPEKLKGNEFDNDLFENAEDCGKFQDNPFEVKVKKKKKKKRCNLDYENPSFKDSDNSPVKSDMTNNLYEIKVKKKKKNKEKNHYSNPSFNESEELSVSSLQIEENPFEVQIKHKKKKKRKKAETGISNPTLNLNESKDSVEESDLILNVVNTPVNIDNKSIPKLDSKKRRKSVRFSDVTSELIIPNNDDLQRICNGEQLARSETERLGKIKYGVDNVGFDKRRNNLDENIETLAKTLEQYQAEIENDINEGKSNSIVTLDAIMVGEVGNPHGEDEKLPDGSTKLKFKHAHFEAKTPFYHLDKTGAKRSYKHLIKGDIVLKFNNTNLHEIVGYAKKKKLE